MDIRPHSDRPDPRRTAQERLREHAEGLAQSRALSRAAAENLEDARSRSAEKARAMAAGDTLDLSPAARLLGPEQADPGREGLIADLRRAYEQGALNTPERLQKAAERLLGS